MPDSLLLGLALLSALCAMGWLALGMNVHWQQVYGNVASSTRTVRIVRVLGACALVVSMLLCLSSDHASIASLVWVMALAAAVFLVAFLLSWRPRWLAWLVPWVRT